MASGKTGADGCSCATPTGAGAGWLVALGLLALALPHGAPQAASAVEIDIKTEATLRQFVLLLLGGWIAYVEARRRRTGGGFAAVSDTDDGLRGRAA